MVRRKKTFMEDQRQTVVLLAMIMNEMAVADGHESLTKAHPILDLYAKYSSVALESLISFRLLSKAEQTPEAAIFLMAEAIAAVDAGPLKAMFPISEKHIRYAKAAHHAIRVYQKRCARA